MSVGVNAGFYGVFYNFRIRKVKDNINPGYNSSGFLTKFIIIE